MKCLLYYYRSSDLERFKNHSMFYHLIENSIRGEVKTVRCNLEVIDKKHHCFLVHRDQQLGGATNQKLLLNTLKRGSITYYFLMITY